MKSSAQFFAAGFLFVASLANAQDNSTSRHGFFVEGGTVAFIPAKPVTSESSHGQMVGFSTEYTLVTNSSLANPYVALGWTYRLSKDNSPDNIAVPHLKVQLMYNTQNTQQVWEGYMYGCFSSFNGTQLSSLYAETISLNTSFLYTIKAGKKVSVDFGGGFGWQFNSYSVETNIYQPKYGSDQVFVIPRHHNLLNRGFNIFGMQAEIGVRSKICKNSAVGFSARYYLTNGPEEGLGRYHRVSAGVTYSFR